MQDFGPAVLGRVFSRSSASGYSVAKTKFGTFLVRRFDSDIDVLKQVFIGREYDLDRFPQGKVVRAAYDDTLQRGQVPLIIDAGANAGFAARFFAGAYPEARILAIEPDPDNAAICRANTRDFSQIEVVEAAVDSRPGHVSMTRSDGASWAVRTCRAESGVPTVTIGELETKVGNSELLIVKVDIEGFESDLFSGATEWVRQTCVLIAEPHDWMLPGAGSSRTMQQAMLGENREILVSGENLIWIKSNFC